MDITKALPVLEQLGVESEDSAALILHISSLLAASGDRLDEGYELADGEAAAVFAALEWLRYEADKRERDLVRHMKYEQGMTWQEVADTLDTQLGGRQAAQKRWARQVAPERRTTTGDRRRGNAEKRAVVDSTTVES